MDKQLKTDLIISTVLFFLFFNPLFMLGIDILITGIFFYGGYFITQRVVFGRYKGTGNNKENDSDD